MKKTLIATLAVIIGLGIGSVSEAKIFGKANATEFPATFKVAVVDVPVLVSKSAQVLSLKQEQEQKIKGEAHIRHWRYARRGSFIISV